VLSVRLDYQTLLERIPTDDIVTVLCDLQEGVKRWPGGAVVYAGSPQHKFNLWIPNALNGEKEQLIELIEERYSGQDEESYSALRRRGSPASSTTATTRSSSASPTRCTESA
jgi:hypothetical protein